MSKNLSASVRQRLINHAQNSGVEVNYLWMRYATERLLYRLSLSPYTDDFVLKGAMLFLTWTDQFFRPTMDLDLLGYGEDSVERMEQIFQTLCRQSVPEDGLTFDPESVHAALIRQDQEYQGKRVTLIAHLDTVRIPLQIDIGFGDVVSPHANQVSFPTLLDFPAPHIRASTRETVIAEKTQAMVALGIANSRMKDFFDIHLLSQKFPFDGAELGTAIKATFERRRTPLPSDAPLALTNVFLSDLDKQTQWKAFLRKGRIPAIPLEELITSISTFLLPVLSHAQGKTPNPGNWKPGGPWQ
jgi:hypothetical protein